MMGGVGGAVDGMWQYFSVGVDDLERRVPVGEQDGAGKKLRLCFVLVKYELACR